MQITNSSISGRKVVFESILDEIPGGVGLNVTRLDSLTSGKEYLKAGAPVYVDITTRIAEVCKSAAALTGSAATVIRVAKGLHFKVGELFNDGTTSSHITVIDASNAGYDAITVAEALIFAVGTKYTQGSVDGASTALTFTPNGLTRDDVYIKNGNADVAVVKVGTVRGDALDYPLPDVYKIALRGGTAGTGTSLITVV